MKHLIGAKVTDVDEDTLYFDNGMSIEVHPWDAWFAKVDNEEMKELSNNNSSNLTS